MYHVHANGNLPFTVEFFLPQFFYRKSRGKPNGKFTAVNDNYRGNGKSFG